MATHKFTISAPKTILAALILAVMHSASSANALPLTAELYHLTICGGALQPGNPCYIPPTHVAPTPEMVAGLSADTIRDFLTSFDPSGIFGRIGYQPQGSNAQGVVYGRMGTDFSSHMLFVYEHGQVICCALDTDYEIYDLNDDGVFIGSHNGESFIGTSVNSLLLDEGQLALDAESQALLASYGPFPTGFGYFAIDDENRISGWNGRTGAVLLTPESQLAVPEPQSFLILLTALYLVPVWRLRRP